LQFGARELKKNVRMHGPSPGMARLLRRAALYYGLVVTRLLFGRRYAESLTPSVRDSR